MYLKAHVSKIHIYILYVGIKECAGNRHYPLPDRISQRNVTSKACVDVFFPSIIATKLQTPFFSFFFFDNIDDE